jgi:cytidylate kinase
MLPGRVLLNGEDVSSEIRTVAVTQASGGIADNALVRRYLVQMQRQIAHGRNFVCEGRDQGTLVFPDAVCKFFLVADPLERARRRQRDLTARGENVEWEDLISAQELRDRRDASRDLAPMVPAADAISIDSTCLNIDQVVGQMESEVRRRAHINDHA